MNDPRNVNTAGTWKIWVKCQIDTTDLESPGHENTMIKYEHQQAKTWMSSLPMLKSILITLVTLSAVIAALSLAAVGWMKLLGTEHIQLVCLTMTPTILHLLDDLYPVVKLTHTWMHFGIGGPSYIRTSDIFA